MARRTWRTCSRRRLSLRRLGEVLLPVHLDQLEEVRECERPDEQPQYPEERHSRQRADERYERMDVWPPPEHHRADDVVHVAHDAQAAAREQEGWQRAVIGQQRDRARAASEATADDRSTR